jgi:hypothetical protein
MKNLNTSTIGDVVQRFNKKSPHARGIEDFSLKWYRMRWKQIPCASDERGDRNNQTN